MLVRGGPNQRLPLDRFIQGQPLEGPKVTRTISCERKFESPKSVIVTTKTWITTQVKMMWYLHSCYKPRRCFSGQTPDSAHTSVDTCHLHCELLPELQSVDSRVTAAVPTRQHVSANEQHVLDSSSSSSSSRRVNQTRTRLLPTASTSRKTDFHINSLFAAAAYLNHFGFICKPPTPNLRKNFWVGTGGSGGSPRDCLKNGTSENVFQIMFCVLRSVWKRTWSNH